MRIIPSILLLLITFSCVPLGTRTKTHNSLIETSFTEIAVVINENDWNDKSFGKVVDSIFIHNIITAIETNLNVKAKYVGNSEEIINQRDKFLEDNPNFDAIINCEIELARMLTLDNSKRYNSKVRTQFFKIPEKILVAETRFNTNLGKTYKRHPLLEVAIRDGAIGAIRPYKKIFNGM